VLRTHKLGLVLPGRERYYGGTCATFPREGGSGEEERERLGEGGEWGWIGYESCCIPGRLLGLWGKKKRVEYVRPYVCLVCLPAEEGVLWFDKSGRRPIALRWTRYVEHGVGT